MYTVTRKNEIHEELAIKNLKGETELVLSVYLRVDEVLSQYNRIRRILGEAQHELSKNPTGEVTLVAFGKAVIALFSLVFGEEGTKKLLEYYGNGYSEMLQDVAPFIADVINPQIEAAMKARANTYKRMVTKK